MSLREAAAPVRSPMSPTERRETRKALAEPYLAGRVNLEDYAEESSRLLPDVEQMRSCIPDPRVQLPIM